MATLISQNPATGETLMELETTTPGELVIAFERAALAQEKWAALSVKARAAYLIQLRETILNRADQIAELISKENGKPLFEALAHEILPTVDLLTFFAKNGPRILRPKKIPLTLMKHRTSRLDPWPLGVVAVISPWNYPFLLPFGEIAMALLAGNSVIFKPSEITPLTGLKIKELCDEAGLPAHVLQTVIGDGTLGASVVQQKPAKVFFTGSVNTGKKIMAAAAEHLIPVNLELGGKDAMIVLPDADLDFATSAALWGGFSNAGQICASVERILVHESHAPEFLEQLKTKLKQLRQRPSHDASRSDLGVVTFERQKQVYEKQLTEAREQGAIFISGGQFSDDHRSLQPTIVTGPNIEELSIYREETFGPVVAVTTYRSIDEAIHKANTSPYGLLASVITRDHRMGEQVARKLQVGTVTINEVTYTAGLAETPWGGLKDSGFGKKHSAHGLLEFVNLRHVHKPRSRLFVFKSLWWFPYTEYQSAAFRAFMNLYRRHWLDRLRAFPHFLWNLAQMIKNEKRL